MLRKFISGLLLFSLQLFRTGLPVAEAASPVLAAGPTSPAAELRVCTQNQNRLYEASSRENPRFKEQALVERIVDARCDVIALQEVAGQSDREAQETANRFIKALGAKSLASYDVFVAPAKYDSIHNAIAVRKGVGKVLKVGAIEDWDLPRLQRYGPGRSFTRLPQLVVLDVPGVGGAARKQVAIVNLHLKSHVYGWKDPTGTDFEVVRMEMAEAVRDWATRLSGELGKDGIVIVTGDTNCERGSAAADILSGRRILDDFRSGRCEVDTQLKSSCSSEAGNGHLPGRPVRFVGLLEQMLRESKDLERFSTYRHGGGYQILDEILISEDDLAVAQRNGLPSVGTEGNVRQGSDHRLAWVELNW